MNLDNLEGTVKTVRGGGGCSMGRLLQSLPEDERDRLRKVAEATDTSAPKLAAFLNANAAEGDPRITQVIINTHRAGGCGCEKVGWR